MQINPPPSVEMLGGKGFHLYKLQEVSRVPPFFILSFEQPEEIRQSAVKASIFQQWARSGLICAAVRSSASIEDSAVNSFAGIFESVLGVSEDNLIPAIESVLESAHGDRVKDYCKGVGVSSSNIRMNVIVQQLVQSRVSGVSFTRLHQGENQIIIEACFGLGEALVSGKITPDTYYVDRKTLALEHQKIGYQRMWLPPSQEGKLIYQDVPFFRRTAKKLSDIEIKKIAETSLLVEDRLRLFPADIEWAMDDANLFVLQARRFTGIQA